MKSMTIDFYCHCITLGIKEHLRMEGSSFDLMYEKFLEHLEPAGFAGHFNQICRSVRSTYYNYYRVDDANKKAWDIVCFRSNDLEKDCKTGLNYSVILGTPKPENIFQAGPGEDKVLPGVTEHLNQYHMNYKIHSLAINKRLEVPGIWNIMINSCLNVLVFKTRKFSDD